MTGNSREALALGARHVQRTGQVVGALDVLGGQHLDDAGHLLGFTGVDAEDVGVVGFGKHDGEVGDALGHLQRHVVAVVGQTGDLGEGRRPGMLRAVDVLLALEVVGDVGHGLLAAHDLSGRHDGVDQGLVAGAAADVVVRLEPSAHLFTGGRWFSASSP